MLSFKNELPNIIASKVKNPWTIRSDIALNITPIPIVPEYINTIIASNPVLMYIRFKSLDMISLKGANIDIGPTQAIRLATTNPSTKFFDLLFFRFWFLYVLVFNHSPADSSFFSISINDPIIPPIKMEINGITALEVSRKDSTPTIIVINPNPDKLISLILFGNLLPAKTPNEPVITMITAFKIVPNPGKNIFNSLC